jgi:hypothetical protein
MPTLTRVKLSVMMFLQYFVWGELGLDAVLLLFALFFRAGRGAVEVGSGKWEVGRTTC